MAKLYSKKALDDSKTNDKKLAAWLKSLGKKCYVAGNLVDKRDKYDIVVQSKNFGEMRIDTKYTVRPESRLFYEIAKHKNSKADYIWYFLNNKKTSFLIKKDALKKLTANYKQYQARVNGDLLVDFDVRQLKNGVDYWQIDASAAFM